MNGRMPAKAFIDGQRKKDKPQNKPVKNAA
jgi:hypothetical protein